MPVPGGVISNLPGLDWQAKPGSLPGLSIVSSNFIQESFSTGSVYETWYAEIRNDGAATICYPEITLELQDAGGVVLARMYTFADTAPYKLSSTVSTPCMAPGTTAALFAIEDPPALAPVARMRRASWTIGGLDRPAAVPHPLAPTVTGTVVERNPGYWVLQGSVRAGSGAIRNIGMDAYPVGTSGWLVDNLIDTNLGSLAPGGSWSYDTTSYEGARFSRYHQFVSFIEGASVAALGAVVDPAVATAGAGLRASIEDRRALRAERDAARASQR